MNPAIKTYLRLGLLVAVLAAAVGVGLQYAHWQRERLEAEVLSRAVRYAVEQFSPAYLGYVHKNRAAPRDNLDLNLPPPRDSLWVGLSRAELYPNGDIHFEYAAPEAARKPLLVWHIASREQALSGPHLCGARDIPERVLAWNGLRCDADVAVPAKDAPIPELVKLPPRVLTPADEVLDAVRKNDPDLLAALKADGRDLCAPNPENVTPLAEAVRGSQLKAIAALLAGCDPNQVELFSGRTPLMLAATARDVDMARALLEAGASPVLATEQSDAAWFTLGTGSDPASRQIRSMLQVKGAAVDTLAADGSTLLMRAAAAGNRELVESLLQSGAQLDLQDRAGHSALMYAAQAPAGEGALHLLLARGAKVSLTDAEGKTALALALSIPEADRRTRVVNALRQAGAKS